MDKVNNKTLLGKKNGLHFTAQPPHPYTIITTLQLVQVWKKT